MNISASVYLSETSEITALPIPPVPKIIICSTSSFLTDLSKIFAVAMPSVLYPKAYHSFLTKQFTAFGPLMISFLFAV